MVKVCSGGHAHELILGRRVSESGRAEDGIYELSTRDVVGRICFCFGGVYTQGKAAAFSAGYLLGDRAGSDG